MKNPVLNYATPDASGSSSGSTASSSSSSGSASGMQPSTTAGASDKVDAQVVKRSREPKVADAPATTETAEVASAPGANTNLGPALNEVTTPEAAVSVLKAKVGILHSVTNNVAHFSSLAFSDVEQLMADISWLTNYIRSKV